MEYKDFADKLGFTLEGDVYHLTKEGFTFYLKTYESILKIKSFYVTINESFTKDDLKLIESNLFNNACFLETNEHPNDTLIVTLPDSLKLTDSFLKACNNFINIVINTLNSLKYTPLTRCVYCHKEAEHSKLHDAYLPLHKECKEKMRKELEEKLKLESSKKAPFFFHLLYSLLLTILATFLNLLLTYYTHKIFTPLLLIIPLASYLGIYLSKVMPTKKTYLLSFVISLMMMACYFLITFTLIIETIKIGYLVRKVIFGVIFLIGGYRIYQMLFAKKRKNYKKLLETL